MAGRLTADGWLFIEIIFFDCEIIAADYAGWIADNFGKAWYFGIVGYYAACTYHCVGSYFLVLVDAGVYAYGGEHADFNVASEAGVRGNGAALLYVRVMTDMHAGHEHAVSANKCTNFRACIYYNVLL
jgi:hypothetical protein